MSDKRKRPTVGTAYEKTVRLPICKGCGFLVGDTGGCDSDCVHDFEPRNTDNTFHAVYAVTETFMGDEPFQRHGARK